MASVPHLTWTRGHPGSSKEEILEEPEWQTARGNRIGFRDRENRAAGLTNIGDETKEDREFWEQARKKAEELKAELGQGKLLTVRDFMTKQEVCAIASPSPYIYCTLAELIIIELSFTYPRKTFRGLAICSPYHGELC